ncbi:pyridoxamine 5'-phosphate oxidase [Sphaerisporangium krabiense]|uniref:Putative pyridoxamine 5'-phosphate oxidase family protein n=1 Tax=Sphaerisporangium krabiense TaxID=763782 RepID=A0A7W8ZDC2_9ACTN|nr:pyridoxamine 5'-phosphate oxidase family protein [Sphaerisporangium krabiense]MBB5631730.1 putative pyridoxamine 5'-phosphate oxidase family protein [Sphaerisporangium krabiense]GII60633.1 pyridoxamine 5'-phosphate oxidase [Sphaerisporangium krabiense]
MTRQEPVTELDRRYSAEDAAPTPWGEARARLAEAEVYWLSTVRDDGRPHVTPLIAVWTEGALYFCTGAAERKAANLADNPCCAVTTGANALREGVDLVLEGRAVPTTDETLLGRVAEAYVRKYGEGWRFEVRDGAFHGEGGRALVYRVAPATGFAFAKGPYGQTRYRF